MFPPSSWRPGLVAMVALALIIATFRFVPGGTAQEVDLQPGGATPNPIGPAIPPELEEFAADWPAPSGNLAGTRAAINASISRDTVDQLAVAWTWPIEATGTFGGMTAPPIVVDDTIFVQDMESNVYALDRSSGEIKWGHEYNVPTIGPNGVAIGYGMVYGALGDTAEAFALDAETGEEVWRIDLNNNPGMGIDMAPTVYGNQVFISTVPGNSSQFYEGGQTGILYALDAQTGAILWPFDTTTDNLWGMPAVNSGGGVWYPLSVDEEGNLFFGTGNPGPWPGDIVFGTPFPNGSSRPGPNDYTNSVVSLDSRTGALRWYHNAKPHDLFDLDFQNTPVIATVNIAGIDTKVAFGSGKTGTVIAYDADSGDILWEAAVGVHENDDVQEIPQGETIRVYPGSLGGVETPIAFANDTVFVPVVNLWREYTALEQGEQPPYTEATGELVALNATDGSVKWQVELAQMALGAATVANDIVFTADLTGTVYAFDTETGDEVWSYQATAGINAPLAIAGDLLLVPAAGPLIGGPEDTEAQAQLIALQLGADPEATPVPAEEEAMPTADEATPVAEADLDEAEATPVPEEEATPTAADATPVAEAELDGDEAQAAVVQGTCGREGEAVFALAPIALQAAIEGTPVGSPEAVRVATSITSVDVAIDILLDNPHALVVTLGGEGAVVACGDIGGVESTGDIFFFGLPEQNDSGYAGIGWLHRADEASTTITVLLAEGLTGLPPTTEAEATPVATPADEEDAEAPAEAEATPVQEEEEAAPADEEAEEPADEEAAAEEVTVEMVDIDFNPNEFTIPANTDATVRLPNLGAIVHNFNIDPLDVHSEDVDPEAETTVTINADAGDYEYYCSIPGHREAGMVGTVHVE